MKRSVRIAFIAGENAADDEVPKFPEDNPYREGTGRHAAWEQGYFARKAEIREHRKFLREYQKRKRSVLASLKSKG